LNSLADQTMTDEGKRNGGHGLQSLVRLG